jgi:hypothetical protein
MERHIIKRVIKPIKYILKLKPDLLSFKVAATMTMVFKNLEEQSSITLNSKFLSYNETYFIKHDNTKLQLKKMYTDFEDERITFEADEILEKDQEYKLYVD